MVEELIQLFENIYVLGLPAPLVKQKIIEGLTTLRSKYKNTLYLQNEGELFTALLNIAQSSNDYWNNTVQNENFTSNALVNSRAEGELSSSGEITYNSIGIQPIDPNSLEAPMIVVQMDCIGYIFGWAKAVLSDYNAGKLSPSGQGHRIAQGLLSGGAASAGRWLTLIARNDLVLIKNSQDPDSVIIKEKLIKP